MIKRFWALGLCLLLALVASSETQAESPWRLFATKDGLAADTIHSLASGSQERILIGTPRGVTLWDSQRFVPYGAGQGLAEGRITAVTEHQGTIWAGSWGDGLCALVDPVWQKDPGLGSEQVGRWISALTSDQQSLWAATYGDGLARLTDGRWTIYRHGPGALPSDWLTALAVDAQGGVWVGTERAGLAHMSFDGAWQIYPLPEPAGTEVTALSVGAERLFVGTRGGVWLLTGDSWRPLVPDDTQAKIAVTAFAGGESSDLWVGSDQGLFHWRDGVWQQENQGFGLAHPPISSLTLDEQGRLWVGTLGHGVAVRGEIERPVIERLPVVLIHGWRGPDSDLLEDSEFWHLARWLREDGFEPVYATGISPEQTLYQNAVRIKAVIAQAKAAAGTERVYLIAFSMGGLNARAYLESALYGEDVARAFILGTPHQGEYLWRDLLLWEHLAWTDEPSAMELLPLHQRLFNRIHAPADVPYTLIAGDARHDDLPLLFRQLPASDGLVSTWSALGVDGPHVTRYVTADLHASSKETILLDVPALLMPRGTYDAFIRPYLFGVTPTTDNQAPDGVEKPTLEPRSGFRSGEISPGQAIILEAFPVEQSQRVRFYTRWQGPALEMTLLDPDGREITDTVADDDDQIEYLSLGFADFASYVVSDTLPGDWSIHLESNSDSQETTQYVAYASYDSPIDLQVTTDREWARPGEWLTVTATISGMQELSAVNDLSSKLYLPSSAGPQTVLLVASDEPGHYVGHARLGENGGYATLLTELHATMGNHSVERGVATTVGISTQTARLTGQYALYATPGRSTGGSVPVTAQVGVAVNKTGSFCVAVLLSHDGRQEATKTSYPVTLKKGTQVVTVPMPGAGRQGQRLDDLILSRVLLLDISGASVLLDEAEGIDAALDWVDVETEGAVP